VRRHEQQLYATLHKTIDVSRKDGCITVLLDIKPDDENPSAVLSAQDEQGLVIASFNVPPSFKLNTASANAWIDGDYKRPS
jgi:hypothetical protein